MPVLLRSPAIDQGTPATSVPISAATSAQPPAGRSDTRIRATHGTRSYAVGDEVQVRSGGTTMIVQGYTANGEVVCQLGGRTFDLPELLLRTCGSRPTRRGRKPGVSPRRNADHF